MIALSKVYFIYFWSEICGTLPTATFDNMDMMCFECRIPLRPLQIQSLGETICTYVIHVRKPRPQSRSRSNHREHTKVPRCVVMHGVVPVYSMCIVIVRFTLFWRSRRFLIFELGVRYFVWTAPRGAQRHADALLFTCVLCVNSFVTSVLGSL